MADSDDKIKISELDPALTLNNTSETVVNQQVSGNWVTFKMTIATLAAHILEAFSSSSLRTTSKTVIGAINELQQGGGGGGSSTLAGLTDVDISSPTNGQILKYNGATDKWENGTGGGGGASALTDLSDVNVSAPSNGQSLIYDSATGKWVNGNAPHNYSTNERMVGTWVDGSAIYERVFTGLSVQTDGANWASFNSIDASDWDNILSCSIYRTLTSGKLSILPLAEVSIINGNPNITIVSSTFNSTITDAIFRYTKNST